MPTLTLERMLEHRRVLRTTNPNHADRVAAQRPMALFCHQLLCTGADGDCGIRCGIRSVECVEMASPADTESVHGVLETHSGDQHMGMWGRCRKCGRNRAWALNRA